MAFLMDCCCCGLFGEELYRDWENHPAVQQYNFIKHLGEGGFSEVRLAQDKLSGRHVALKIIFLNRAGLTSEQRKILAGEATLIRMLAHPNIIRCMQVLETRRQQVLVLEHLSGGEMLQQLQRVKRYTEAHACQLFRQLADAVAYLHGLSIMHRDIKPENCLLAKPAQHYAAKGKPCKVKLIDLGMAGLYRPARPLYGCMGSPGFIAPEVVLGDAHTPALDIYSLGVLLFVMLVGRKPWDAQRSHTLQYAIQATAEAPGLRDPVFLALSQPARELLLWMLHEEPGHRPTATQVLGHKWMLQNAQGKGIAASSERLIQPAVQQRLHLLGNSRQVMGTARGMLLLHSSGSRSGAVAFHKAVKQARLKLQQQAAALEASGQLQQLLQHEAPTAKGMPAAAIAAAADVQSAGDAAVAASSAVAAAKCTAQQAIGPGDPTAQPVDAPLFAAATGAGSKLHGGCSDIHTVGQLARQSLTRKSMLFDGKRPTLPPVQSVAAVSSGAAGLAVSSSAAAEALKLQTAASIGTCEALERGMSLPNPDFMPLMTGGDMPCYGVYRADRAVSVSPGALALLDADDRLCLLAAGTSADDGSDAMFSWSARRGAADMVASFRQQYPMRPILKSIARFGHSLSSSLSKSFRHGTQHSNSSQHGGHYMAAAAAARGVSGVASPSEVQQHSCSMTAAVRMLSQSLDGDQSDTDLLLAGHAVHSSCELVAGSTSNRQPDAAARGTISRVRCGSPQPASTLAVEAAGQIVAESSSRGSAAGSTRVSQPAAAAAQHGKPVLPALLRQQQPVTAGGGVRASRACPTGMSMQRNSSGREDLVQDPKSPASVTWNAAMISSDSADHSVELAFLGTQFSMSPPLLSPQTSYASAIGTMAARTGPDAVQETEQTYNSQAISSSSSRREHSPRKQQLQLQGVLQCQDQVISTEPHVLPAILSETSLSACALSAGSLESYIAAAEACETGDQAAVGCAAGFAQRDDQKQTQQRPNNTTPFNSTSASAAAASVVVLLDAVLPVTQLQQAPTRSRRGRNGSNSTAGATPSASLSSLQAATAANNTRTVVNSPRMRAAATAAAARAEEEGLDLPNGLWLQRSQSVDSSLALSPAGSLLPTCNASSALQSPLVGVESNSAGRSEYQLQQAVKESGEADERAGLGASSSETMSSSKRGCGSGSISRRNTSDSVTAGDADGIAAADGASGVQPANRHRRDPSMLDWVVDTAALQCAPDGRDASGTHWSPHPAPDGDEQQQQQGGDIFASLAWLTHTSSEPRDGCGALGSCVDACIHGTANAANVLQRSTPLGSSAAAGHAIPMRAAAHRVAVPYRKQNSSRQKRRAAPVICHINGRRSGSINASTDGDGLALAESTEDDGVLSAGGGAGTAATIDNPATLAAAANIEQRASIEVDARHASSELTEFYVGSFTDRQGLTAAGGQLGHTDRLMSTEDPIDDQDFSDHPVDPSELAESGFVLVGQQQQQLHSTEVARNFAAIPAAAPAAAVYVEGGSEMQVSTADGKDGLLLGMSDMTRGDNLCTNWVSFDGSSGGKAAVAASADGKGATLSADSSVAAALASSRHPSGSTDSRRSSIVNSVTRATNAAAIGQSKVAAAAAAAVAHYSEKQQYHQQQYSKQLQSYSDAAAVPSKRTTGGPATVAIAGGAWYFLAGKCSSRSSSRSSSSTTDTEQYTSAANGGELIDNVSGFIGVAAPTATAAAAVQNEVAPAFDAVRHAGGVAWLVRGLSGKYHMQDEDAAMSAAAATGLAGADLKGLTARQQQPTFDDFDEPTAYYYAS